MADDSLDSGEESIIESPSTTSTVPDQPEEDITEDRRQILIQFQEIVAIDSEDESLRILERHNWNLEVAVQSTFNEHEGLAPVYSSQPSVGDYDTNLPSPIIGPTPRRESGQVIRHNTWLDWLSTVAYFPYQLTHAGVSFCYHCVSGFLLFFVRIFYPGYGRGKTEPVDDVLKFKKEYEETYGSVHPTLYLGSYSQVLSDAKKELKFILVYLHSKQHQSTPDFCHTVLSNPGFTDYINGNMLFWGCDVSTNEGYKVSRAMRETTYPFLAIVCLRDNRMTIVWRIEGPVGVDEMISICAQVIDENEPGLIAARTERQVRSRNQELREDQDLSYLESLRKDQEKEKEKELRREEERREEEARLKKENEKLMKAQELAARREAARQLLSDTPEPGQTDEGSLLVKINLPDRKLQRYFLQSDRLSILYQYVLSYDDSPSEFILNTNFPKKTYPIESESCTLAELGIKKPTVFFVHDLLEESSDEYSD